MRQNSGLGESLCARGLRTALWVCSRLILDSEGDSQAPAHFRTEDCPPSLSTFIGNKPTEKQPSCLSVSVSLYLPPPTHLTLAPGGCSVVVGAGGDGAVGGGSSCHLPLEQLQDDLDVCCDPGLQSEEDRPVTVTSSMTNKNLLSDTSCVCVRVWS